MSLQTSLTTVDESVIDRNEGFTEAIFVSPCRDDFHPPKSSFMMMHWVRALVHMYCISFQQLEREVLIMQERFRGGDDDNGSKHPTKMSIAGTLLHMMHAWAMLGKCMDSPVWRAIARSMGQGVPPQLHQWYRGMPYVSDEEYVRKLLSGTCTPTNYPRMDRNGTNGILIDGFTPSHGEEPYYIPMEVPPPAPVNPPPTPVNPPPPSTPAVTPLSLQVLSWLVDSIHGIPAATQGHITMVDHARGVAGSSAVQSLLNHATFSMSYGTLTCLSMPRHFLTSEQYWFLVMCIQSLPPSSPHMQCSSIRVRKVCAGTLYHMYSPGGGGSYDNLGDGGGVVRLMAWSAAAHMARSARECMGGKERRKKARVYLSLPGETVKCPHRVTEQAVQEDISVGGGLWELPVRSGSTAILSWRRRSKVNSIGHIVVGWVAKALGHGPPLTARGWG